MDTTFNDISEKIQKHLVARGWEHNPARGLAISIALEANELLEHYQWNESPVGNKNELAEELADIFIYAFQFASIHDINIPEAIENKLIDAGKKYPVEHYVNKSSEEKKRAWIQDKINHKKKGL